MKAKLLSFPFISFSESGLFKGLRRIQIKNLLPFPLASGVARRPSDGHPVGRPALPLLLLLGWRERIFERLCFARLVVENDSLFLQVLLHRRFARLVDALTGGHAVDLVHELLARLVV